MHGIGLETEEIWEPSLKLNCSGLQNTGSSLECVSRRVSYLPQRNMIS